MRAGLATRVGLVTGLTIAALFLVLILAALSLQRSCMLREVKESSIKLSETIRRSLRYSMLRNDREAIAMMVRDIGQDHDLHAVRVISKTGRIVFSSQERDVGKRLGLSAAACKGCHKGGAFSATDLDSEDRARELVTSAGHKAYQLITPIRNEHACASDACHVHRPDQKVLGVLEVEMSIERVEAQVAKNRSRLLAISGGLALLPAAFLFFMVKRLVGSRIALLVEGARRLAAGDPEHRVKVGGSDEIGVLASAFNNMADTLTRVKEDLLHADRLVATGRLAAGVAHELNNPLTAIMLVASALQQQLPENENARQACEMILRETRRCRDIVQGLLDFSRQRRPKKAWERIEEIVQRAVDLVAVRARRAGITIECQARTPVPQVWIDAAQMQQVILNLLVNALDAVEEAGRASEGKVLVTWGISEDGRLEISVQDNGNGIAPENIGRIFEPFFTTKGHKGTGLGLSVALGIVEMHGGEMAVTSEQGKGSTFVVKIGVKGPQEGEDGQGSCC